MRRLESLWILNFDNVSGKMPIFEYKDEEALGQVMSVDTSTVIVDVQDLDQLKRLQVNRLAVLQSSRPGQHLIGLISQVTRKRLSSGPLAEGDVEIQE